MRQAVPAVRSRRPAPSVLLLAVLAVAATALPVRAGVIAWGACPAPGSPDDLIGSERYVVLASSMDDSASGGSDCTFRDAIATVEGGSAQNGCLVAEVGGPAPGDPWVIVLPAYTYTLDGSELSWDLFSSTMGFALCGQGAADTEIRAAATASTAGHRVLQLYGIGRLRAWGVSISNGVAPDPFFDSLGVTTNLGGGILLVDGTFVELHDSRIHHNVAAFGGGGIACAQGSGECFSISNSVIDHNAANQYGGGLYGRGDIVSTIIRNNVASNSGGGLYTFGFLPTLSGAESAAGFDAAFMRNTLITSNAAGLYGGGWYNNGFGWVEGVTISDNSAQAGGGLAIDAPVQPEYLTNLTVSGNRAESQVTEFGASLGEPVYRAAGVWVRGSSTVELYSATIVDNENLPPSFLGGGGDPFAAGLVIESGSTVTYRQSVIAGNEDDGVLRDCDLGGTTPSDGYNRAGATCDLTGTGDFPADPAFIEPLADNGGSTDSVGFPSDRTLPDGSFLPTHAILDGGAMIDDGPTPCVGYLGAPAQPLPTDARGFGRYDGDDNGTRDCDIGAYEWSGEKVLWIDGFEIEFVSPCNWSSVVDPSLCVLK